MFVQRSTAPHKFGPGGRTSRWSEIEEEMNDFTRNRDLIEGPKLCSAAMLIRSIPVNSDWSVC